MKEQEHKETGAYEVQLTEEQMDQYFPSKGDPRREVSPEEMEEATRTWEKLVGMPIKEWDTKIKAERKARNARRKLVLKGLRELSVDKEGGVYKGVTHFFSETGTEGGYWAFQDLNFISEDGKNWSYEGLRILEDTDHLTILKPENLAETIWSGEINLKRYGVFKEDAFGLWIHSDQKGVEREQWARWFFDEYPAILKVRGS